ncbi:peptidase S1 and S6 chymotrypsin Hap [Fructilactobacillus fructivorans]|uniref:S1C family serine protease n=1 Tax=Fructilactobacillus fructivorans TaxID=1614 RepID=UPI0007054C9D|nr:trypsin-like peptidase domain-containing protein [Fructilactobacillus fructivorans]KRN13107.1 peptidase S1 and S6 chymotrypsin Hap [Fructilactobacillus fructivorans]
MKRTHPLLTVAIVALVAGLLGGGIAYGGITWYNGGMSLGTQAVPAGSNRGGTAKVENVKVNASNQAEKVFKNNKDTVVSVINTEKTKSNDSDPLSGMFGGMFGGSDGNGSKNNPSQKDQQQISEGSGVVYKKDNGSAYIVTNNHVVSGSSSLEVVLSNGQKKEAKLVGHDAVTDLAVLKINGNGVNRVANFGNSDDIKVGQTALAIGSPLGSEYASSLTEGIISAKKREVPQASTENGQQNASAGDATVIQTDAAINPGNSGGPLLNIAGQVVGINSMKLSKDSSGTSVEGMGFAIPSNEVVRIINQLIKDGKVIRPELGIKYVDLANISVKQQKSILKLPGNVNEGVVVMDVNGGSPASKAGLKKNDVITKLAGKAITNQGKLRDILYDHNVGDKISVTYYRNGQMKTAQITLDQQAKQQ